MCGVRLALFTLVLCVGGYSCSFVYNDTTVASWPPLYGVDEWVLCQREEDVYCIVDAALVADKPSELLMTLEEFSKQKLLHFNRTQVHRGVCVSRCGARGEGQRPWDDAAAACLARELAPYGLRAEILSVKLCTGPERTQTGASARALAAVVVLVSALVVLATALHVLGDRCAHVDGNKYLLAFSMKRNWEILTYDRSKPRTDQRMKDFTSMEGIRVMGVQSVITAHVIMLGLISMTSNPDYFEKSFETFGWRLTLNSPVWLQSFVSMSAFLTTYVTLITTGDGPLTLWNCFLSIVNRYVRLTPAAGIALWFVMTWFPRMAAGPQWALSAVREADDCAERWWVHLLYAQNHLDTGKLCMPQTWYLALDMQLHVVGMAALWVMLRWRRAAAPLVAAGWLASALAAGLVAYIYDITPILTGQAPELLRTLFKGSKVVSMLYLPSWMNLVGYAAGMATALIYHHTQVVGIKLNQKKWFTLLFHSSLPLGTAVVAAGVVFMSGAPPPRWAGVLYSALDRPLVTICFNVFLLGCFTKCKSGMRSMFEWRGFHFLGRVSYSVFLLHNIVIPLSCDGYTQLWHMSFNFFFNHIISVTVITYIVAIPFCLVFELPPIQLWKALVGKGGGESRPAQDPTPPVDSVKPLDLVANIRQRQEVC